MERSLVLKALHDVAVQSAIGAAGVGGAAGVPVRSARIPRASTSADMAAGEPVLDYSDQDHVSGFEVISERRDRIGIRGRRTEDRLAYARTEMLEEADQRRQKYELWLRRWTESTTIPGSQHDGSDPAQIETGDAR